MLVQVTSDFVRLGRVRSGYVWLSQFISGLVRFVQDSSCRAMPGYDRVDVFMSS